MRVVKYNISSKDLQDCAAAGFRPLPFVCACVDGNFLWDNDLSRYIQYSEDVQLNHERRHSKFIIPIPLKLNMTLNELMELCLEAGLAPIRHIICQCIDGNYIWDESAYRYVPHLPT